MDCRGHTTKIFVDKISIILDKETTEYWGNFLNEIRSNLLLVETVLFPFTANMDRIRYGSTAVLLIPICVALIIGTEKSMPISKVHGLGIFHCWVLGTAGPIWSPPIIKIFATHSTLFVHGLLFQSFPTILLNKCHRKFLRGICYTLDYIRKIRFADFIADNSLSRTESKLIHPNLHCNLIKGI